MALTQTTLASAFTVGDSKLIVTSGTGFAAGYPVRIDGQMFQVSKGYVPASTTVPVSAESFGTLRQSAPSGAKVLVGAASDLGWGTQAAATAVQFPVAARGVETLSYSAAGAITLPKPGADMIAYINGTSALAMTVADPDKAMDGSRLSIRANGAANHTITFASGLSGSGASGSDDVITINATNPVSMDFVAVNGFWHDLVQTPLAGTVTNITATVA